MNHSFLISLSLLTCSIPCFASDYASSLKAGFTTHGTFIMRSLTGPGSIHEADPSKCLKFAQAYTDELKITEYPNSKDMSNTRTVITHSSDNLKFSLPLKVCGYAIHAGFQVSEKLNGKLTNASLREESAYTSIPNTPYKVFHTSINKEDTIITPIKYQNKPYLISLPTKACTYQMWDTTQPLLILNGNQEVIEQYSEAQVKYNTTITQLTHTICNNALLPYTHIRKMKHSTPNSKETMKQLNLSIN